MRRNGWFQAAAASTALTVAPIRADIPPPDRPIKLVADAAHSPALVIALVIIVAAVLGIYLYRRQRKLPNWQPARAPRTEW